MSAAQIQHRIERLLSFLQPYASFVNCHMVNYLTDNLWEKHVPLDIQSEIITKEDVDGGVSVLLKKDDISRYHALRMFLSQAEEHYLENFHEIVVTEEEMYQQLEQNKTFTPDPASIKEFMNSKKRHEVEEVSKIIAGLVRNCFPEEEVFVIDAGDGKGYLSSRLALEYKLKVLGVDASEVNTAGSKDRMRKFQKVWPALQERSELSKIGVTLPARRSGRPKPNKSPPVTRDNPEYKSTNNFITTKTDFDELIQEHFPVQDKQFITSLTGLHTCGNLASTCLKIFTANPRMKLLCNVGCCYHLLNEEFLSEDDDAFINKDLVSRNIDFGFPMSKYLRSREVKLGRNARMLAAQSIHRTRAECDYNTETLFYRALLEVIMKDVTGDSYTSMKVGKLKKYSTFNEYLQRFEEKFNMQLGLDDAKLSEILSKYSKGQDTIKLFYLIRMIFAQVLESLILLDRFLYLKENNVGRSFLLQLFDPVISPRCYGIIALK